MGMEVLSDDILEELHNRICSETVVLRHLEQTIEGADSDSNDPISDPTRFTLRDHKPVEQRLGTCQSLSQARRRRSRPYKTKQRTGAAFDLRGVNELLRDFVTTGQESALELPDFTTPQRKQVKALAAVYGLEPRNCGRKGQTLFATSRTAPLSDASECKVQSMLACSLAQPHCCSSGNGAQYYRAKRQAQADTVKSGLAVPLGASNKGCQMLQQMGWQEGTGLGAYQQGDHNPLALSMQHGRQGLGSQGPQKHERHI